MWYFKQMVFYCLCTLNFSFLDIEKMALILSHYYNQNNKPSDSLVNCSHLPKLVLYDLLLRWCVLVFAHNKYI